MAQHRGGGPVVLFNLQHCLQKAALPERPLPATSGCGCVRTPAWPRSAQGGPRTDRTRTHLPWCGQKRVKSNTNHEVTSAHCGDEWFGV